jgi:YidC/Oxa1 family membrane protein insertase
MWDAIIIKPFINALLFIYTMVGGNFGIAIILFTILIRLVTHPLMVQQIRGTQGMQELQKHPRWIEAQEKYKGDKEKLAQEQMALYKELKINPFGSCLPMLIQFPVIIGLYQAIIQAMANTPYDMLRLVRHVYPGFLDIATLVPLNNRFLWMDLGQPERLNIPGIPFAIPVLAVLVVITTYMQSKLMAPPQAQTGGKDQTAQMMGMMNIYMPIFMGWLAWTLASGLALYFVVSNLAGIMQYAIMGRANWKALIPGRKAQPAPVPQQVKPSRGKNESRKNNPRSNRSNS